uniref:ribonuclease H n=1 Tax=Leptobrachium leishanense TaxID=445787 RepID=A0A8C5QKE1_9ANUR
MRAEIREMLELGVIEPSASPWASPVVLVPKKDGTTRFCVDYRRINDCTITDAYPMPRVDELLDQISGGHFLTTVDLCKGYWQIPLAEEATPKSAFITPFGLYQFRVMPFGMKNAPATFQRLIDRLLDGLQGFACAYLDDIAIYSQTWEEHLEHVGTVLGRIRDANLTLKPEKCKVGMAEVQYLGHRVGCGIQRPEPAKIEAILDWPTPVTKTQVLAFLGTAGYYRKFVPHYSDLAKPLTDLTKKSLPRQVLWSPECEQAFRQLKAALTQVPLLAAPNYNKCFIVHTDASMFGLGAVLSQVGDDGGDHPVAFISRKLLPREVGYAAVEKECLALVWALRKLQPYVYGRSFTVMTDHNPLVWLNRVAGENGRLLRWSLALQPFNFSINIGPGRRTVTQMGYRATVGPGTRGLGSPDYLGTTRWGPTECVGPWGGGGVSRDGPAPSARGGAVTVGTWTLGCGGTHPVLPVFLFRCDIGGVIKCSPLVYGVMYFPFVCLARRHF